MVNTIENAVDWHACLTGDCPHEKQTECVEAAVRAASKLEHELAEAKATLRKERNEHCQFAFDAGKAAAQERAEGRLAGLEEAARYLTREGYSEHLAARVRALGEGGGLVPEDFHPPSPEE